MARRVPDSEIDLAIPESPEPRILTPEIVNRAEGMERGTLFDWAANSDWSELFDDETMVVQRSDRTWISDVEEMLRKSGQAASVEKALSLPLRMANLTIEAPDKDRGQSDLTREVLYSSGQGQGMVPDIVGVVSQMTYAIATRRSFHELVWNERKDGRFGFSKIAWRPPSSCEVIRDRRTGDLRGFRQFVDPETIAEIQPRNETDRFLFDESANLGYIAIPRNRAVIYIHGQHRDPVDGVSDLEVTHWAYTLQQKILMLWTIFLDGASQPKIAAYGSSPTEAKKTAKAIAGLRGSGVIGLTRDPSAPDQKLFEVIDHAGKGAVQFQEMIQYLERQMSHSVLAGFLDLTSNASEGIGSYALSADQKGLFLTSRQAASKEISAAVTQQIIAPLVRVNFGAEAAIPRLVFEKMSEEQTEKAIQMLQQLGSANNVHVPPGFLDLLVERVAQFLDLDDAKVEKMLKEYAEQRRKMAEQAGRPEEQSDTPQGQVTDNVNAAIDVVKQHQQEKQ